MELVDDHVLSLPCVDLQGRDPRMLNAAVHRQETYGWQVLVPIDRAYTFIQRLRIGRRETGHVERHGAHDRRSKISAIRDR